MKKNFFSILFIFLIFPAFSQEEEQPVQIETEIETETKAETTTEAEAEIEELQPERIQEYAAGTAIEIRTSRKYSSVYLNGIYKGTAPLTVKGLIPGKYLLRVEKTGCETEQKIIKVSNNTSYLYYIVFK